MLLTCSSFYCWPGLRKNGRRGLETTTWCSFQNLSPISINFMKKGLIWAMMLRSTGPSLDYHPASRWHWNISSCANKFLPSSSYWFTMWDLIYIFPSFSMMKKVKINMGMDQMRKLQWTWLKRRNYMKGWGPEKWKGIMKWRICVTKGNYTRVARLDCRTKRMLR